MKLSTEKRQRQLRALRRLIVHEPDVVTKRIAYAVETAVYYVTENTVDWPDLVRMTRSEAVILKQELKLKAAGLT